MKLLFTDCIDGSNATEYRMQWMEIISHKENSKCDIGGTRAKILHVHTCADDSTACTGFVTVNNYIRYIINNNTSIKCRTHTCCQLQCIFVQPVTNPIG